MDISNQIVLGWDAQKFWVYKTINFYDNGNLESLKNLDKYLRRLDMLKSFANICI